MRLADVARPYAAAEPKGSGVAGGDHFLDVSKRDRRDDRAEYLLLRDAHVVANIGKDGRRDEEAFCKCSFGQLFTAGDSACTLLAGNIEIAVTPLQLLLGDQRADLVSDRRRCRP